MQVFYSGRGENAFGTDERKSKRVLSRPDVRLSTEKVFRTTCSEVRVAFETTRLQVVRNGTRTSAKVVRNTFSSEKRAF